MGLLSKIKKPLGVLKNKAGSAIGALRASKFSKAVQASRVGIAGLKVARAAAPVAKFAVKRAGMIGAAVTVGSVGYSLIKGRKRKKDGNAMEAGKVVGAAGQVASQKTPLGKRLLKAGAIAGGAGLALYGAEKLAEKLGVRGGAGFIGRRKKARRKSKKARKTRRSGGRKPKFGTKAWMAYIRQFRGKGRKSTLSYRRKRGRRGKGVSKTELRSLRAALRRYERD